MSVITATRVASEPVPAVVGIAITGAPELITWGTLYWRMGASRSAMTATALAVSMDDPPPSATTLSWPPPVKAAVAAATESVVGSGTQSPNTPCAMPASSSRVVIRPA